MANIPPITTEVDLDTAAARREAELLGDELRALGNDAESLGDRTEVSARRGVGAITELRSAFELLRQAGGAVIEVLEQIDRTIEATARRSSELQLVSQALAITPREAQGLLTLGQAVGVDEGDIRGFFDPIQEFGAEVQRRPNDPGLQERVQQLQALGFDPDALSRGGSRLSRMPSSTWVG